MSAFTASDLDLSHYPDRNKWPNGLDVKVGLFGILEVIQRNGKEYHKVSHDYVQACTCPCKWNTERKSACRHIVVANYVLLRRQERLEAAKKPADVVEKITPVVVQKAPGSLTHSPGFSLFKR